MTDPSTSFEKTSGSGQARSTDFDKSSVPPGMGPHCPEREAEIKAAIKRCETMTAAERAALIAGHQRRIQERKVLETAARRIFGPRAVV